MITLEIVAVRGDNIFLISTSGNNAIVVDLSRKSKSPEMDRDAFLKFGYWENYAGNKTADQIMATIG